MENVILQVLFVFFVSMVPFLEVFLTVPMGIIVFDFSPLVTLTIAVLGNAVSVLIFIFFGSTIKAGFHKITQKWRRREVAPASVNPKIKATFERYGALGVCFASSLLFSSQVGASTVATFGISKRKIFVWTNLGMMTLAVTMATLSVFAEEFVVTIVNLS
ncbi:hypothetical protein [Alkalibacillus salilacus]|uniref:Small multi-drug export protein n=1 Tax=Alkalibacillus salilacus TaxID=284582 RepID=A0ABT9VG69_9BACI|nr:hypothetical protein [Alkalibacillus salilacus]MDQ0159969.1 hypothetical protein [Alkalibacillus salilacus]